MRGLDEADNPYRDKYGPWDRWLLENARNPTMEEMRAFMDGSAPEGYIYLRPSVTAEGWLIPQLEELRTLLLQQSDYGAYKARPHCVLTFSSAGEADPALAKSLEAARLKVWADVLPHAPTWLTGSLPKRVILLPDGGAVTYGPLGSGKLPVDPAAWRYDGEGNPEVYYRYSAQGSEVARTVPGQPWQELFLPGYTQDVLLAAAKEGMIPIVLNGYTILAAQATGEPAKVFDYDGAELAPEQMRGLAEGRLVVELEAEHLAKVAALQ